MGEFAACAAMATHTPALFAPLRHISRTKHYVEETANFAHKQTKTLPLTQLHLRAAQLGASLNL